MIHFSELSAEKRNELLTNYHLPMIKSKVYVDEHKRPYEQTDNGRIYCSRKTEYEYEVKN